MSRPYQMMEYRQQEVMSASPIKLILMAYDVAITACEQSDFDRATNAVSILRDALNYDYAEAAVGLFGIYQWCLDCIRNEDYASAAATLRELREAWGQVERRFTPALEQPVAGNFVMVASPA
jgi:flagellin-specific chaperone FliS